MLVKITVKDYKTIGLKITCTQLNHCRNAKKNDGSGRAAAAISQRFSVSQAVIYQIRKVLKHGSQELINSLRRGDIPVKTAYKRLGKELEKAV